MQITHNSLYTHIT